MIPFGQRLSLEAQQAQWKFCHVESKPKVASLAGVERSWLWTTKDAFEPQKIHPKLMDLQWGMKSYGTFVVGGIITDPAILKSTRKRGCKEFHVFHCSFLALTYTPWCNNAGMSNDHCVINKDHFSWVTSFPWFCMAVRCERWWTESEERQREMHALFFSISPCLNRSHVYGRRLYMCIYTQRCLCHACFQFQPNIFHFQVMFSSLTTK